MRRLRNANTGSISSSSYQGTTAKTEPVLKLVAALVPSVLTLVTALVLVVVVVVVEELVV